MIVAGPTEIVIITGGALKSNPRVLKEAETLARHGYGISVLSNSIVSEEDSRLAAGGGFTFQSVLSEYPTVFGSENWRRIQGRVALEAYRHCGLETRWLLGSQLSRMLGLAKQQNARCYISHLEAGNWVGQRLLRQGLPVAIDMEDWFSEDLLPEARRNRPLGMLRRFETDLLNRGVYATSPSQSMSAALAGAYGCEPPAVIYNAFPWEDRSTLDGLLKDRADRRRPAIHWFSQTVGPGRGLEDLFAALPLLRHPAEIHLRGTPTAEFAAWFAKRVPEAWRDLVFVHDTVAPGELLSRIAEHDIGFAGEMKYCRSRDLTVTNKILQYLLAGLAVVASDTAGQQEVADQARGAALLYPSGDAEALAARLDEFLGSPERLSRAKAASLAAASKTFCWERQERTLLDCVERALRNDRTDLRPEAQPTLRGRIIV